MQNIIEIAMTDQLFLISLLPMATDIGLCLSCQGYHIQKTMELPTKVPLLVIVPD